VSEEKGRLYVVKKGDWLSKIARRFKLPSWETIWDHENNAQYKKNNRDPNLIYPGDEFWIPGVALDEVAAASGPQKKARDGYTVVRCIGSEPFIEIFRGTVQFVYRSESFLPRDDLFWQTLFEVVIVEVRPRCTLSIITKKYFGREYNENDDAEVAHLYSRQLAEFFERRGVVGGGNRVNFPKLYQRGQVPTGYEESSFDPDSIYPGQCIFLMRRVGQRHLVEVVEFRKPAVIDDSHRWMHTCWLGLSISARIDVPTDRNFMGKGKNETVSMLFNLADLVAYYKDYIDFGKIRWVLYEQPSRRVILGGGATIGVLTTFAYGFPNPMAMTKYTSEGWDWEIAFGLSLSALLKSVKGAHKGVKLVRTIQKLKAVGKALTKNALREIAKSAGEEMVKDRINTGVFSKPEAKGIVSVPIPFANYGYHLALVYILSSKIELIEVNDPRDW